MNFQLPYRKGTILIPSGPCRHLHIVCNDPVYYPRKNTDCVLLVNISSIDPLVPYDPACLINAGEHPFVIRQSYVYYKKADLFGAMRVAQNIATGDFSVHQDISDALQNRIIAGFFVSDNVTPKIRQFVERNCQ